MKIIKIKLQIKKIAKDFDLKYDPKWFKYIFLNKEDHVLINYILGCPHPEYNKFGKEPKQKLKNIIKFLKSSEYKLLRKNIGGQVLSNNSIEYLKRINKGFNKDEEKIKIRINRIIEKIGEIKKNERLSVLTISTKDNEINHLKSILIHELIHILLNKNKISREYFKNMKGKWEYDEGLTTYLTAYAQDEIDKLNFYAKCKDPHYRKYYTYALKFKKLLKNNNTSKQRKQVIINFYKEIK